MSFDPKPLIPPRYANVVSLPIYDPDLPHPLFRTYVRLTGLAWVNDYRETPPLTLAELCAVCHCSERTFWGHLVELRKRRLLSWKIRTRGEMVLSLAQPQAEAEGTDEATTDNLAALAEFGVETTGAFARQVAALPHVTPDLVRAWGEHYRQQKGIHNLPGLLLHTLQTATHEPKQGRDPRGGPRLRQDRPPPHQSLQARLPELALDDDLRQALERLGLAGDGGWAEVAQVAAHASDFVWAWVEYVEKHRQQFKRPAGFLRSALRGNTWPPDEADPEARRREQWQAWRTQGAVALPEDHARSRREETMARHDIASETMDLWEQVQKELSWQMTRHHR
jgi:hypothetical protein